jgi:hypothetical protein
MLETFYKTAKPETSVWDGEYYSLHLKALPERNGYQLTELHGWWDDGNKTARNNTVTISPEEGFESFEQGQAAFIEQRTHRAKEGFIHRYVRDVQTGDEVHSVIEIS